MIVIYTPIASLDDVDLESLYDSSIETLEQSYMWWPEHTTTPEQKKSFFINVFRAASHEGFGGGVFSRENFFAFKAQIDGVDSLLSAGFVDESGTFHCMWYLSKPDSTGSRNWLYATAYDEHALYRSQGITALRIVTFDDAQIARNIRMRAAAGAVTILDKIILDDVQVAYLLKVNEA